MTSSDANFEGNLVVGITGHQNLIDGETEAWIAQAIDKLIDELHVSAGYSCLAVGADQLFAQKIIDHRIELVGVLPCAMIEDTFQDPNALQKFRALKDRCTKLIQLDFNEPSENAFYEAGKAVVNHSHIIIAVWNGKPAKGLGGTGDIVKYARESAKTVIHLNLLSRSIATLK